MSFEDAELLKEFVVESQEHLSDVESQLLTLESQGNSVDVPLVNTVFRAVHSIKGAAGFLGLDILQGLAHREEEVLNKLRNKELRPTSVVINTLLKATDRLKGLLDEVDDSNAQDVSEHLVALERILNGEAENLLGNIHCGKLELDSEISAKATTAPPAKMVVTPARKAEYGDSPLTVQKSAKGESEVSATGSTIRVDVSLLDKLMTCVGELVLARNQILQFTNGKLESELHKTSQRLNIVTNELQEGVLRTRMQPIGNVWSKFPRLVRDLAAMCEKQVRIEMEGKETELDRTIIEAIKDPLTHLVRNIVDHGIEPPEVRLEKGKTAEGCLTLRAYHEGGQVNIEICDDGAGLNFERIKAMAIQRGLMTREQIARMADRDVGSLIFSPGFSTAEKVSNVSGRGVGMDVVKTNIEKIGGTVDLQSRPGLGTTIKIKIPLTLAIIPALFVANDGNRYAIPRVNLLELVRLDGEHATSGIEWIQGSPVYRLRGRLFPLVYLREQLMTQADEAAATEALNIVVLRADDRQFGLVVDSISDFEEIVVKPLSKQLKGVTVYSGTTIMGDGRVALILDVMGLAHASKVRMVDPRFFQDCTAV